MDEKVQTGEPRVSLTCPRCGRWDIVASLPRNFWDELMRSFGKVPKHCRSCGKRFFVREKI